MKPTIWSTLVVCALLVVLGAPPAFANLLVLVDPASDEAASLWELGLTPVGDMDQLIDAYDPGSCLIAIGQTGYALADWTWITRSMPGYLAVASINWDFDHWLSGPGTTPPPFVDHLITVHYILDGEPTYYPLTSYADLQDFHDWACWYVEDYSFDDEWDDWGSWDDWDDWDEEFGGSLFPSDLSPEEIEMLIELFMPMAEPFLFLMDVYLQPEWEYKVLTMDDGSFADAATFEATLNAMGEERWELSMNHGTRLVFKRRAQDAESVLREFAAKLVEMMELWSQLDSEGFDDFDAEEVPASDLP